MEGQPVTCAACGDRIGVYEPLVVNEADGTRTTSLAREPLLKESNAILVHSACATAQASAPTSR